MICPVRDSVPYVTIKILLDEKSHGNEYFLHLPSE